MQTQILVLSDLHIGSAYGLLPPDYVDVLGNTHTQNEGQKYLWDCFGNMLGKVAPRPIKHIVVNGDLLDGRPDRGQGMGNTLHRFEDQRGAALKVLQEVQKIFPSAKWFFISGTPNHELRSEVETVSGLLTGVKQEALRTLPLRVGKAFIRFHHEVSFSSGFLKAAALERELITSQLSNVGQGWEVADAEIRSHCHYFRYVGMKRQLGLVTPCWQLQTDYVVKGSPTRNIPDVGGVVLSVDDGLKEFGMCPVGFTEYLYRHPEQRGVYVDQEEEITEEAV